MPIYYDEKLTAIAWDKADKGCRKPIKDGCDHYEVIGDSDKFINHLLKADQMGYIRSDLVLTLVRVNQGLCFFNKPIWEVKEFIEGVKPVLKGVVAPKVLDKMVYARLSALKRSMDEHNEYMASYGKHAAATAAPITFPEIRTIQGLKDFLNTYETYHYNAQWVAKKIVNAFYKEVLNKPELLDENIHRAYDLYTIHGIMEE